MQTPLPAPGIDRRRVLCAIAAGAAPFGTGAQSDLQRVARAPDVQAVFTQAGGRPLPLNADDTRALLARDIQRCVPLVRAAGLKAD